MQVELEGWVRLWENANCISPADLSWVKDDTERGLFTHVQVYKQSTGTLKRRRVMKSDRMWFYPPDPPGYVSGAVPSPNLFFRSRIFVWRPVGVWRYSLKCPRGEECVGRGKDVHLYKSGYHTKVRHICNWMGFSSTVDFYNIHFHVNTFKVQITMCCCYCRFVTSATRPIGTPC